jgi:hypothetical protein
MDLASTPAAPNVKIVFLLQLRPAQKARRLKNKGAHQLVVQNFCVSLLIRQGPASEV